MPSTSPCGLGGASQSDGPCTGTYSPSQAGQGVFDGISTSGPIQAIINHGGLIAGVGFALFLVFVVATFFGEKKKGKAAAKRSARPETRLKADPYTEDQIAQRMADEFREAHPEFFAEEADVESDTESDSEDDSELDQREHGDAS